MDEDFLCVMKNYNFCELLRFSESRFCFKHFMRTHFKYKSTFYEKWTLQVCVSGGKYSITDMTIERNGHDTFVHFF